MLTIVLDTNILVGSFLTPHGESWEVVRRAKGQKLCLSPFILIKDFPKTYRGVTVIQPGKFLQLVRP